MEPWLARAEDLCYEGEEVTESVSLGEGGVVVTTHRVLAFAPESEGKPFQEAKRPNVEDVRRSDVGTLAHVVRAVKLLVVGAVLVVVGVVLDLDALVGDVGLSGTGGAGVGLGGVMGLLRTMLDLIAMLDDLMVLGGALALLAAAAMFGVYLWSTESSLVVDVAGGDELEVVTDEWPEGEDVVGRVERAIAPGSGNARSGAAPGSAGPGSATDATRDGDPLA